MTDAQAIESEFLRMMEECDLERSATGDADGSKEFLLARNEICLAFLADVSFRPGVWRIDTSIHLVDLDFEAEEGCNDFEISCFHTFSAYSANFPALNDVGWIRPDSKRSDLRETVDVYRTIVEHYPTTRQALRLALAQGAFAGLPLKHFGHALPEKHARFVQWINERAR